MILVFDQMAFPVPGKKRQQQKSTRPSSKKGLQRLPDKNSLDADFNFLTCFKYSSDEEHPFLDQEAIDDYIANVYGIDLDASSPKSDSNPSEDEGLAHGLQDMLLHELFTSGPMFGQVAAQYDHESFPTEYSSSSSAEDDEIRNFLHHDLEELERSGTIFDHFALSPLKTKKKKPGKAKTVIFGALSFQMTDQLFKIKNEILQRWLPSDMSEFEFPPFFDTVSREKFHKIARHLNCKSKSHGPKSARVLVFSKTKKTPRNYSLVSRGSALAISSLFAQISKHECADAQHQDESRTKPEQSIGSSSRERVPTTAKLRPGQIVGESAPPISESNVGNMLLRKLGWSPGSSIGKNANTGDPLQVQNVSEQAIKVVFRKKNSGLGS